MLSLQEKLAGALEAYQRGAWTREQFLEAAQAEYELNQRLWEQSPHGELGDALAESLELYAQALDELTRLLETEVPLDEGSLQAVWDSLAQAEQRLQNLEDICEGPDEGESI